jgi:hypothetical protein
MGPRYALYGKRLAFGSAATVDFGDALMEAVAYYGSPRRRV